jgi:hypothetical protein
LSIKHVIPKWYTDRYLQQWKVMLISAINHSTFPVPSSLGCLFQLLLRYQDRPEFCAELVIRTMGQELLLQVTLIPPTSITSNLS